MKYSQEGVYEVTPGQRRVRPSSFYETELLRGMDNFDSGSSDVARAEKSKNASSSSSASTTSRAGAGSTTTTEPLVHESAIRLAHAANQTYQDPDDGAECTKCATCPGFALHTYRKVCKWCRCPRWEHAVKAARKLGKDASIVSGVEAMSLQARKYEWAPQGLTEEQMESYFRSIPKRYVPLIDSKGASWRRRQLLKQGPRHDTDYKTCDRLTKLELTWFQKFDADRMRQAFDIGDVIPCPDLSRPPECSECFLMEDGTHWPYCSRFIEPSPVAPPKKQHQRRKNTSSSGGGGGSEDVTAAAATSDMVDVSNSSSSGTVGRRKKKMSAADLAAAIMLGDPDAMPDIKSMKKSKRKDKAAPVRKGEKGEGSDADRVVKVDSSDPYEPPTEPLPPAQSGGFCRGCSSPLMIGEMVVQVGRFKDGENYFHPGCFMCSECGELLVDLRCYVDFGWEERGKEGAEQRLFCGRHFSDNRRPRCAGCDETIHQAKHVFELGRSWHFRCFSCHVCDHNLTDGLEYVPEDDKPLCLNCHSQVAGVKCTVCERPINSAAEGRVTIKDYHWHSACFACTVCGTPLEGKPCVPKLPHVYCKKCRKAKRGSKGR